MPDGANELTERQRAVLERIESRMPIKSIASELGISPTRVNQHVRAIKNLYGVNSLAEMVERFREGNRDGHAQELPGADLHPDQAEFPDPQVPLRPDEAEKGPWNDSAELAFSDALSLTADAPWRSQFEPEVVPGMLDGRNFVTARLLAMLGAAVGMMSLLVLVLTSILSLGEMLERTWHVPEANTAPTVERGRMENAHAHSGQSGRLENQEAHARG